MIHHLDKSHFQALAAILEILGVWVVGGGVLLQRSRNLEFWNPRPWISIYTKFQLSTIILKEFEKFLGVWVVGVVGGGVLLLQSQNLNFWNRRPWISLHTKFQVCTIILKILEICGARGVLGVAANPHGFETLIFEFSTFELVYIQNFVLATIVEFFKLLGLTG